MHDHRTALGLLVLFLFASAAVAKPPARDSSAGKSGLPAQQGKADQKPNHPAPGSDAIADIAPEMATHIEVDPLPIRFQRLTAFRLRDDGALLACDAGAKEIKCIGRDGHQTDSISMDFAPEALCLSPDGQIYCGGEGRLVSMDGQGKILHEGRIPDDAETPLSRQRRGGTRPVRVSGIAVTDQDVFVAFGSGWSTGSKSKLYRLDRQLQNPKLLMEGLRGCCQRCDILWHDGTLYLAENAAHRVVLLNRSGDVLQRWGERQRDGLEGFSACCNPMNLAFDNDGILYTSESGLGRVKRYTPDGKFIGLVGYVATQRFQRGSGLAASCSNMVLAVTPDTSRVYVMDYRDNMIRVLQRKEAADAANGE